ncbi:Ribosomal RNA small subunit methyltransferase G [Sesamum angolense]|uniref:Ribosomal RNA small subunit methyltransferase G n=1 Tax=Sesamum angolense TaxID=2727404 RepID=A0AAE1WJJ1_9LAMI|nr:Ribosomal RNA small subunit methyltransferase G [Sesamum angolense]
MLISLGARVLLSSCPVSIGTFFKHLPTVNVSTLKFNTVPAGKTTLKLFSTSANAAASAALETPHFQTLTCDQKYQIRLYVDALLQWNQKMNLTAVREENEVMERHVEDSLAIIDPVRDSYLSHCGSSFEKLSVVDVGSGAGLPGLILAIGCPRQNLGQNIDFREGFDIAVARAVAEMRVLAEYCLPLVRVGGLFVAAKGHDPQEEVAKAERAIHLMGASVLQTCFVESHSKYGQRTAIICLKDGPTPRKYPRAPVRPSLLTPLVHEYEIAPFSSIGPFAMSV